MEQNDRPSISSPAPRASAWDVAVPAVARLMRVDVLVLLAIFFVFHYFKLSNFLIAIDDEYEALRSNGYNWILTGRWASYVFLRYLVPQPIVPFFPAFIFGLGIVLSYPLLLSCFGIDRLKPVHYLTFPLYAGFPTWMFLTSLTTASCWAGLAQLMVVVALDRFRRTLDAFDDGWPPQRRHFALNTLISVASLAIALGFYQAFLLSFMALGLGLLLLQSRDTVPRFWIVCRRVIWLGTVTVLGVFLHGLIDLAFRHAFGLADMRYVEAFLDLHALIAYPLGVAGQTLRSMRDVYAGLSSVYGVDSFTFPIIILSGMAAVVCWRAQTASGRVMRIALAVAVLCAPFALYVLNGGAMPLRTLVGIPSVFWLFALIGLTSRSRAIAMTAFFATALGLVQTVYSSSLYYAAGHFARVHDQQLAAAVYSRIVETHPDFDAGKAYNIDFFGARPFTTNYPRPFSSTLAFSFFEWDGGNEERMLQYMSLIGYDNLRMANIEQRRKDLAEFQKMPVWPARDSVRVIGDVTLIKLGAAPGFPFNKGR